MTAQLISPADHTVETVLQTKVSFSPLEPVNPELDEDWPFPDDEYAF
jgi:hypothetical protein